MRHNIKKRQPVLNFVFIILCVLVITPFVLLVSISFSDEMDILKNGYSLFPRIFSLEAYKYVFQNPGQLLNAYKVTIIASVAHTLLVLLMTSLYAYPLSQKMLPGRKAFTFYLFFTMLFGGGLVPTYILNTQYLHMQNTMWIYIIPGLIAPYYVFMTRTFFSDLPDGIIEAALIDGANDFKIFATIVLPLSKPVLATVGLFTFLGAWNGWYASLLYITDDKLVTLQYLLQRILQNIELMKSSEFAQGNVTMLANIPSETVRMAMAIVVAGPALVIFPFFQKYFVKGINVGAVKG